MTESERKRRMERLTEEWHAEHARQLTEFGRPRDYRPFLRIADAQQELRLAILLHD